MLPNLRKQTVQIIIMKHGSQNKKHTHTKKEKIKQNAKIFLK